jgi:hypothetical protein
MAVAYLSRLPVKFLQKVAGFQKEEGSYYIARAHHEPLLSLRREIFPWADDWLARMEARAEGRGWKEGGLREVDAAAHDFLKLLIHLRDVLLQDLAILQPDKCSFLI